MMRKRLHNGIALIAVLVLTATVGCYTLLKHPRVPTEADVKSDEQEYSHERVSFSNNCQSCHNEDAAWSHAAIAIPPPRATVSPSWYYYYEQPWWYQYYSSPNDPDQKEQKKRGFDRRRFSRPVDSSGGSGAVAAPVPTRSGALARPVNSGDDSNSTSTSTDNSGKREAKRSNDTKKKKTDRRKKKDNR